MSIPASGTEATFYSAQLLSTNQPIRAPRWDRRVAAHSARRHQDGDLAAPRAFYIDVLGMQVMPRSDFAYPGAWLGLPGPGTIFHIYAGGPALGPAGTAAIDHVSLTARGYHGFIARLQAHGVAFREFIVLGTPLWQLFAYGPNGMRTELTFDSWHEDEPLPDLSPRHAYVAGESFFVPR